MRIAIILGCFFLVCSTAIHAQKDQPLSKVDQLKIDANNARFSDTELATFYLLEGLKLSKQKKDEIDIGYFYRKLVSEKGYAQQLDSARYYFDEGIRFYKKMLKEKGVGHMQDELLQAHLHSELGEAYSVNFQFEKSKEEYTQALKYYAKFDDYIGVGIAKFNIGNLSFKQGDFPVSIQTFLESKSVFDTTEYHYIIAEICNGISAAYEKMNNLHRAVEYGKMYLKHMKKDNYEYPGVINAQIYLAKLYAKQRDKDQMQLYLSKARKGIDSLKLNYLRPTVASVEAIPLIQSNDFERAKTLLFSVKQYLEESKVDGMLVFEYKRQLAQSLVKTGDDQRAKRILEEVIRTVDSLHLYQEGVEIAKTLAQIYEDEKRYDRAYNMLEKHQFYTEQTIGLKQQLAFKEIETKYQNTVQKNQLLEQQQKIDEDAWRLRRNELMIVILVLLLVLSLLIYFFFTRSLRAKKQKELHEQELKSSNEKLRISRDLHDNIGSELTLIKSKIDQRIYQIDDQQEIESLTEISNYSKYAMDELRKTIWATKTDKIQLSELEEKIDTFVDRFTIEFTLSTDYTDTAISSLTGLNVYRCVQEAVQNAVKHSEAKKLHISIDTIDNQSFQITVSDNGKGFDSNEYYSGNGLENMKARITEIGGQFDLQSSPKGTQIVFSFRSL